jgi:hypothetical protein
MEMANVLAFLVLAGGLTIIFGAVVAIVKLSGWL